MGTISAFLLSPQLQSCCGWQASFYGFGSAVRMRMRAPRAHGKRANAARLAHGSLPSCQR